MKIKIKETSELVDNIIIELDTNIFKVNDYKIETEYNPEKDGTLIKGSVFLRNIVVKKIHEIEGKLTYFRTSDHDYEFYPRIEGNKVNHIEVTYMNNRTCIKIDLIHVTRTISEED